MQRTRIELLSSGTIDMFDDVSTPLNFAIADIREPENRDASYSKTIKIPATKNNNKLFTHIFDLGISDSSYNPNRKADCILYIDDVPQIYGYLQLLNIEVDDKNDMVYNCAIRGQVGNIFQKLGDTELRDLSYSSYNHTLNRTNQKASWANTYSNGYVYPMMDYGFDNNFNAWDTTHFLPAIFLRTYIDKIFSYAGYTYESSFFDSQTFKKLIIPSTDVLKYSAAQIAAKLFTATRSGTQNIPTTGILLASPSTFPVLAYNTETNDPSNAYNTSNYRWTPPSNGYYNLLMEANINTSGTIFSGTIIPTWIGFRKYDTLTGTYTMIGTTSWVVTSMPTTFNNTSWNNFLKTTDYVETVIYWNSANYSGASIQWQFNSTNSQFYNSVPNSGLQYGDTVDMSLAVPEKIKCKDLLKDIIKMFGLYVDVDKQDSNRLLIETRDDFYSSGTINDWTYKLDNSRQLEIIPMGDLDFKIFNYKYKSDKDEYNSIYETRYNEIYGNRKVEVENEFVKSDRTLEIMFSPTPMVAATNDDKVMPKIWDADNSGVVTTKPSNIRLLYYGGEINTNNSWTYSDNGTNYTETTYPYCGHLNSLTSPTFDLSFAPPKELFYNTNVYTNANIYNLYHKKYIDEITDPDSKIVVGYFYLTPKDIFDLDFRDNFYFEGQYFRLNKIYDYDPINKQPVKCEFIKIKGGIQLTASSSTVNGGVGSIGDDLIPIIGTINRNYVINQGGGNIINPSTRNAVIVGGNNYVHGGNNITLLNSSGCIVYDGLQNVTVVNSSGTTISDSNSLTIFNTTLTSGDIASLGNEYKTVAFNASDYYGDFADLTPESTNYVNRYIKIGKTLYWTFHLQFYTTSGADSILYLKIPNGYESKSLLFTNQVALKLSTYRQTIANLQASSNIFAVSIYNAANFGTGTGHIVSFTITFEIE